MKTACLVPFVLGAVISAPVHAALETAEVQRDVLAQEYVFDGVLEAVNRATVAAQTSARVEEILYDTGDYVEKGAVIIRFRDKEQRAALDSATAGLREAEARRADAAATFERVKDVHDRGLLPKSDLDRAAADLASARARVQAAEAAVNQAREGMEHTVVRAPYSGIVEERHIEAGETATVGRPLMTGLSLEHLRAVVDIPQHAIASLREHRKARIILPQGESLDATELRMPPNADPQTHTFRVLVTLPEGQHGLFPGMLVKVAFAGGDTPALLVPARAVVTRSEVTGAYVVDPQGRVSFRYIRTGTPAPDGRIPVLSGLHEGEQVALDPVAAGVTYKEQELAAQ